MSSKKVLKPYKILNISNNILIWLVFVCLNELTSNGRIVGSSVRGQDAATEHKDSSASKYTRCYTCSIAGILKCDVIILWFSVETSKTNSDDNALKQVRIS